MGPADRLWYHTAAPRQGSWRPMNRLIHSARLPAARGPARQSSGFGGLLLAAAWLMLLLTPRGVRAQAAGISPTEFQVAFVAKVIPYVTWPDNTFPAEETPLVIGLFGGDPFDGLLQKLIANEKVEGRRLEVKVLADGDLPGSCQVVFVRSDKLPAWYKLTEAGPPRAVLTIAADDSGDFLRRGGLFNLRTSDRKLEIDRGNVGRAGLKVSAKLLRIAKVQ